MTVKSQLMLLALLGVLFLAVFGFRVVPVILDPGPGAAEATGASAAGPELLRIEWAPPGNARRGELAAKRELLREIRDGRKEGPDAAWAD